MKPHISKVPPTFGLDYSMTPEILGSAVLLASRPCPWIFCEVKFYFHSKEIKKKITLGIKTRKHPPTYGWMHPCGALAMRLSPGGPQEAAPTSQF